MLIYISVLERRVWILGDHGINARIQPNRWQELVDRLTLGIREGRRNSGPDYAVHCHGLPVRTWGDGEKSRRLFNDLRFTDRCHRLHHVFNGNGG